MEPQEILDSIQFGTRFYNQRESDMRIHYFHMTALTENYIILPLTSLTIDIMPLFPGIMKDTKPLTEVNILSH